jgi:hexulose-6-phosphate isomerase
MKKGVCYGCITAQGTVTERLFAAKTAGYDGVEMNFWEHGEGPLSLESTETEVRALAAVAARIGVELPSAMTGAVLRATPLLHPDPSVRQLAVERMSAALERLHWLGAGALLVHPGQLRSDTPYDKAMAWTQEALRALVPAVERTGVDVAIENVWNKFLLSPLDMREVVDGVGHPSVGAYFDVGNVLLFGFPEHWIQILGTRIKRVHVKDFKRSIGTGRGFCQLLDGDADYPAVVRALRQIGYDGYLTSEVGASEMPEGQTMVHTSARMDRILGM